MSTKKNTRKKGPGKSHRAGISLSKLFQMFPIMTRQRSGSRRYGGRRVQCARSAAL